MRNAKREPNIGHSAVAAKFVLKTNTKATQMNESKRRSKKRTHFYLICCPSISLFIFIFIYPKLQILFSLFLFSTKRKMPQKKSKIFALSLLHFCFFRLKIKRLRKRREKKNFVFYRSNYLSVEIIHAFVFQRFVLSVVVFCVRVSMRMCALCRFNSSISS